MVFDKRSTSNYEGKKYAIYVRQSDGEKTEHGLSLETQEALCRDYIENELKGDVFKVYKDAGVSASHMNRGDLKELVKDAKFRKFDFMVCAYLDRISRVISDYYQLKYSLQQVGVEILSQDTRGVPAEFNHFMQNYALTFAENLSKQTGMKVRQTQQKALNGGYWVGGNVPLGYKAIDAPENKERKILVKDEAVEERLNQYFKCRLERKNIPESIRLSFGENSKYKKHRFYDLEKRIEFYTGTYIRNRWNKRKISIDGSISYPNGKQFIDEDEWERFEGHHDHYLTPEQAEEIKNLPRKSGRRGNPIISRRVFCGICKEKMHSAGKKLICNGKDQSMYKGPVIKASIDYIHDLLRDGHRFTDLVLEKSEELDEMKVQLIKEIEENDQKQQRLLKTIEEDEEIEINKRKFRERIKQLQNEKGDLDRKLTSIKKKSKKSLLEKAKEQIEFLKGFSPEDIIKKIDLTMEINKGKKGEDVVFIFKSKLYLDDYLLQGITEWDHLVIEDKVIMSWANYIEYKEFKYGED